MIKAAMITPNLSVGGAERWVVSIIKNSDPAKLQWTGCALSGWGGMDRDIVWELSRHVPIFSEPKILKTVPKGKPTPAAVSTAECEKFITRAAGLPVAVRRACQGADVLVAWGSHQYRNFLNNDFTPNHFVLCSHCSHLKPHEIKPVAWCDTHLVAVSEKACKPYIFPGNPPVSVIYNGVDVERLQPRWGRDVIRQQWGVQPSHKVLGYIGRQSAEKNPAAACQAMAVLDDEKWRAVYYGNLPQGQSPPKGSIIEEAKANRYPIIQFHDYTASIGDVYAGLDVLMLASNSEAFSLTLIESWLTRTPVISTPVGSVPELEQKYGQLTFPVPLYPSPDQLADACMQAVSPEASIVIDRAYRLAREQFTARSMADRWAEYLDTILSQPGIREVSWAAAPEVPNQPSRQHAIRLDL